MQTVSSNLYENDSSYLIAMSPKLFENNRIKLKLILGYRYQSLIHALPSNRGQLMNYRSFGEMLPHEQRAYLREKFLHQQHGQGLGSYGGLVGLVERLGWWRGMLGVVAFVWGILRFVRR